ncbi:diaminopropionate ammonia-lyase [Roseibium sp.]|uniref:diaminopropionate ammonia-lyase n=2 Tax=Roseibium sp. TaxID=1936156 RepID=UPI0032655D83
MFPLDEIKKTRLLSINPGIGSSRDEVLPGMLFDEAEAVITSWDGYRRTPLIELSGVARELNLRTIHYKHEGPRFGLGSFKALGGAYAVLRVIQRTLSKRAGRLVDIHEITDGRFADQISEMTIISATDGNHGRSVAWGCNRFGANCRIYIHAEVSDFRADAMRELGAAVVRIDGDYDATVERTRTDAEQNGWMIVSDTSWPGYSQAPRDVMAGYGVMAREIVREIGAPPTHVFLQGGVGGLAAAVIAVFQQEWGNTAPRNIVVEPELAPCLFASAKAHELTRVKIERETLMAGLSCGEPSRIAWDVLAEAVHGFMTIPETLVGPAVRLLANGDCGDTPILAGESAVAGLIGLMSGALNPEMRAAIGLDSEARVLLLGSEGVTDPGVFEALLANPADSSPHRDTSPR